MTDKELQRLSRKDLLELMIALRTQLDKVNAENDQLKRTLKKKAEESAKQERTLERISRQLDKVLAALNLQISLTDDSNNE